jgi:hypothetical protein
MKLSSIPFAFMTFARAHSRRIWEALGVLALVIGLVTGLATVFDWFPKSTPKLSLALYAQASDGRRYVLPTADIDGQLDASHWPNVYVDAPIRLAIHNPRGETLASVRVRLVYDPSVTVISTAQQRTLRSGEIAYEQPLGEIEQEDEYAYLPLVDTLKIASWMHGEEVISLSRDNIPMLVRLLLVMPFDGRDLDSSFKDGHFIRDMSHRELPIRVTVSSANRAPETLNLKVTYALSVELVYPPKNLRSTKIQVDPTHPPALPLRSELICDPARSWVGSYSPNGGEIAYAECREPNGPASYQLVSYQGKTRLWIVDSRGTGLVDSEWFGSSGTGQPTNGLRIDSPFPVVHWSRQALH